MVKVKGSRLVKTTSFAPKCERFLAPIAKKTIDLDQIGHQHNNSLLDLIRCQQKALKICATEEKKYSACHASVMGTGSYNGNKNCGAELELFMSCVTQK